MTRLAERTRTIGASLTSGTRNRAQSLAAAGTPVLNLAAGELDFDPPAPVLRALRASTGPHRYTETAGIAPLREALAARVSARLGHPYGPGDVVFTNGAKHALYLTMMALFGPGDEVLVPTPAWGTFLSQLRLVGATPVPVDTVRTEFLPTPAALDAHRTERTRGIVLNSPNNPTGVVYPAEVLASIVAWARRHDLWLIFDESYGELVFPGARHVHPVECDPASAERVISVGSFSKSHAVTGWRVGYLYGPPPVVQAAKALQSHLSSHAPSVLQQALLPAACGAADDFARDAVRTLTRRRDRMHAELAGIGDLVGHRTPDGAFYLFLDCRPLLRRSGVAGSAELADRLLTEAGVATVAGTAFGADGFLRLSLTLPEQSLAEAARRLTEFVRRVG